MLNPHRELPPEHNRQSAIGNWQSGLRTVVALLSILLWASCGNIFRPVAIPAPPVPPDPEAIHFAFMISTNGAGNAGSAMQINVSGDSNFGVAPAGRGPSHVALLSRGTRAYVANAVEDTVTTFFPANAINPILGITTISLPAGSHPSFVHSTEAGSVYVANSGNGTVAAISTTSNVVTDTIAVGMAPVALAETPDARKLYVVNQGDSSISSINPVDKTVNPVITDASISSPVWAVARSDSQRVYVLSQGNGSLTVIDTFTDALLPNTISVGAGANFMFYDSHLSRLYITNPVTNTLSVVDATADPPVLLASVPMAASPISVTALPDGSRAYVASSAVSGGQAATQVTVINTSDNSVRKVISLGPAPAVCDPTTRFRLFTAAAATSARVYVGNCDAGAVSIIRTSDDTFVLNLPAPVSAFPPPAPGEQPPPQNPVFVVAGP